MIKTRDFMDEEQVRNFYNMEPEDPVEDVIQTHNGDWIKEEVVAGLPSVWRFWEHEGIHE